MRLASGLAIVLLFLSPVFAAQAFPGAATIGNVNYTRSQAANILSNTSAYVNRINESGYIFSYPNMSRSYAYLNEAAASLNQSPGSSVFYAEMSAAYARETYAEMDTQRPFYTGIAIAITFAAAFILYFLMIPVKKGGSHGKSTKRK